MRTIEKSEIGKKVECKCGCGKLINKYDKENRRREYSKGHNGGKNKIIKDKKDIENLIEMYINQRNSSSEIAKIYSCSNTNILKALRRNGIKVRTLKESMVGHRKGIKKTKEHIENMKKAIKENYLKNPELSKSIAKIKREKFKDEIYKKEYLEKNKGCFKKGNIPVNKGKTKYKKNLIYCLCGC